MLTSTNTLHAPMKQALYTYACAGNGDVNRRLFSSLCDRTIAEGQPYIAKFANDRGWVESRHCAHCSLAFLTEVKVAPEVVQ